MQWTMGRKHVWRVIWACQTRVFKPPIFEISNSKDANMMCEQKTLEETTIWFSLCMWKTLKPTWWEHASHASIWEMNVTQQCESVGNDTTMNIWRQYYSYEEGRITNQCHDQHKNDLDISVKSSEIWRSMTLKTNGMQGKGRQPIMFRMLQPLQIPWIWKCMNNISQLDQNWRKFKSKPDTQNIKNPNSLLQ